MNCRFVIRVCVVAAFFASIARADNVIVWKPRPATAESPQGPSQLDRQRASVLARESIDQIERNDLPGAEAKLRAALALVPDKAIWHYNLACILVARGQLEPAMDSLQRAADFGFTDFTILEGNPGLKALHDMPRYRDLLAHKEEIRHKAGQRALADLQQQFGPGYLYEVDEEQKLIFATNTDQATLDALKTSLLGQLKSQCALLFEHKPDEFIRVVVPSLGDYHKFIRRPGVMGIYEDESRTLLANRLGQVMTHEFTHALHAADQRAVGQEHPIWLREGLASMYEAGEFVDGDLVPHDNFRLGFVQSAARRHALIPLEKLLSLRPVEFIANPNLSYGESSSLLLYLYDQKLLRKFYDRYKASYTLDPTGQTALEAIAGMHLPELQKAWETWELARESPSLVAGPGSPYLGVHFGNAVDGLKVAMVLPGSAASKAGLKPGDLIVALGDREVRDYVSFAPLLAAHKAGDEVKFRVRRDGSYIEVPVVLGQR